MSDGEDAKIYDFFEYKRSKEAQKKQERKRKRNRKPVEQQKAAHPSQMSEETRKSLEATLNEKHTAVPKGYTPYRGPRGHLNSSQFGVSMPYNPDSIEIPWTFVPGLGGDQTIPGGIQRPDSDGLDD